MIKLQSTIELCVFMSKKLVELGPAPMAVLQLLDHEAMLFNDLDHIRTTVALAVSMTNRPMGATAVKEGDEIALVNVPLSVGMSEFHALLNRIFDCDGNDARLSDIDAQLSAIGAVVSAWVDNPAKAAPYESCAEIMLAQKCFTASAISRRLSRAAAFRNAGSGALSSALEVACSRGLIRELTHSQKIDLFGESGKKIYQLI